MQNILIPLDGTERSMHAVDFVRRTVSPGDAAITIIIVREDVDALRSRDDWEEAKKELTPVLRDAIARLSGYNVETTVLFGRAGEEIVNHAETNNIDTIVMTKSTRGGWQRILGSVATYVVKYAPCIVTIVPEERESADSPA